MRKLWQMILSLMLGLLVFIPAFGQTLQIVAWNIESGQSSDTAVAARIREFQGIDIWGMSEVRNDAALLAVEQAAEDGENADFRRILGETGGADRLGIVYNFNRFNLMRTTQLTNIGSGNQRAPLVAEFLDRQSNQRFLFMVNHLARGNNALRHQQAAALNQWVGQQTLPAIAVGDFNFDWSVANNGASRDTGFDNMIRNGAWSWVRPMQIVMSHCGANYNSILDFVFVNNLAASWNATSEILVKPGDCPVTYQDDMQNPDHRPVKAVFNLSGGAAPNGNRPPINREEILRRINEMEKQLKELKTILQNDGN